MYAAMPQEYEGFGKFKFKKIFKKVAGIAASMSPTSIFFPGLTKKAFGIKSAEATKGFKLGRKVFIGATLAVGAVVAAPFVIPALTSAVSSGGSMLLGGLKFMGGKLMSAPQSLIDHFSRQGQNINDVPPGDIINAAQQLGHVTPQELENAYTQLKTSQATTGLPPSGYYPQEGVEEMAWGQPKGVPTTAEAGMFAGGAPTALLIGGSLLALMLFSKRR